MPKVLEHKRVAILAADGFETAELFEPKKALEAEGAETVVVSLKPGSIRGWSENDWGPDVAVDVPLLSGQRQLWLAEQADPGSLTHTIPLVLDLTGPLRTDAFAAAVNDVVAHQPGLRGTFVEVDGSARVAPAVTFAEGEVSTHPAADALLERLT